jgi:ferredoxin--NADP+ reductase/benzoate/toluate 1,2-dioxygenase reductase subunit
MRIPTKIISNRALTESAFVLRFERNGFEFRAGQYLVLSLPGFPESREYSIYSGEDKAYIEILVKEIPAGAFSRKLKKLKAGDAAFIEGPFGYFIINDNEVFTHNFLFIATGTGISPFHSFVSTYGLNKYTLLHGVRLTNEAYDRDYYNKGRYLLCTTRDNKGDFEGRVTSWLRHHPPAPNTICLLCGNAGMIEDAADILEAVGIPPENIRSEVFF